MTNVTIFMLDVIMKLSSAIDSVARVLKEVKEMSRSSTFEWVDSALINALEHGDWLLIENANFCR